MKKELEKIIAEAISALQKDKTWPAFDIPEIEISHPKDEKFGDYTTNVAMVLGKITGKKPMETANIINQQLTTNDLQQFEKLEVAPPGYINFYLSQSYLHRTVTEINRKAQKFGNSILGKGKKVQVEFISANPTGPIHLGNGRGGPLGDALASILEKVGYKVEREFYVNDWGNQIDILGHSVTKDEKAEYRGEYIDDLAKRLPKNLKEPREVGYWAAGMILEEMVKPTCGKLGIKFDNWFSEKTLHEKGKVDKVLELFKKNKLVYEKEGALWYKSTKFGDDKDRVLVKTDGEKTYFAVDTAYHKNKFDRGFDKVIDIWGADHYGDVIRVKSAVEEVLGYKSKLDFIITQFVRVIKDGKEVRMSKRKGVYFALDDLIEEVGKDAVRFIFLSYAPATHVNFDINLARERSEKNPVYYVQYAHARIFSILRKSEIGKRGSTSLDQIGPKISNLELLTYEKELSLMRELNKFPELISEIAESYEAHKLPHYAIKLADKFHAFYEKCRVINEENPELNKR